MARPELANALVGHAAQEKSKSRLSKSERVGHSEIQNQFLSVDVLEWYHAAAMRRQKENCGMGAPLADTMGDLAGQAADLSHKVGKARK
jgi:hypothetical protein